ncbi:hypothetical protein [Deinococcus ficus]|uniref:hypothetical protein n=1 Tax=Deinococcus ficus TaxID=317577 RepID=UPI0003B73CD2|nr:hypothetical protein [Deinococcus ficus]
MPARSLIPAVLVLSTLLAYPTPVPLGTATARTIQGNSVFQLKAFLRVRGPVRQLSEANTLLVLANAGAAPIPLTLGCMTVRYRVFEAGLGCASGDREFFLQPGQALNATSLSLLPDVAGLPAGNYRLPGITGWRLPSGPTA